MFVKFSCDCVGLNIQDDAGRHLVVSHCDRDDERMLIGWRDMGGKTWTLMSIEQSIKLLDEIGYLVADGYRFRLIQNELLWRREKK